MNKLGIQDIDNRVYDKSANARRVIMVDGVNVDNDRDFILDSNEGGNIRTTNPNQEQILTDILKQLKIMNLHLSILSDNQFNKSEV